MFAEWLISDRVRDNFGGISWHGQLGRGLRYVRRLAPAFRCESARAKRSFGIEAKNASLLL
jgi:hypothetical protein